MTNPTPHGQVPEALRLAHIFDNPLPPEWPDMVAAAAELRRQHTRIAELEAQIEALSGVQALSAAPAVPAVPAAWKAVPVNPTPEMWRAAKSVPHQNPYGLVWDAMLAASPTPPAEQQASATEVALVGAYARLPDFDSSDEPIWEAVFKWKTANPGSDARKKAMAVEGAIIKSLRDFADRTHALRMQAAPKAAPGVVNSVFDHQTAADFLSGKTVSDEAVRKFVAASRWAHDERSALSATLLAMHGVLTSREAEIALLKKALMEAETAPQQEAQEPVPSAAAFGLRLVPVEPTDQMVQAAHHIDLSYMPGQEGADRAAIYRAMIAAAPQPAPAPQSERDAFERDWEKRHAPVPINGRTHDDGRYGDSSIQDAWESWQARAALAAQGGKDA